MKRSIEQAAVGVCYVEKARIFRNHAEIRLADALLRQSGFAFQATNITTTVRSYALADIMLDGDTGFVFQDKLVIPETAYAAPQATKRDLSTQPTRIVQLDDSYDHIIGYNAAHGLYQHWLTQCIPAIDWGLRQNRTRSIRLVLPPLAPWQEELLDILGYSQFPRFTLKPGTLYLLPHAEYSEFLNGTASFGVCLSVHETAGRILDCLPPRPSPFPILVVPCVDPYYGTISNNEAVIDLLRRSGAYVVDPSLKTAERINLFRHADVVIGPLGPGLADVIFCKPSALLWEWMPRHHQNASVNRLAQGAALDYLGDLFENEPAPHAPGQWVVDLDIVACRISEISQRLAMRAAEPATGSRRISCHQIINKSIDEIMAAFESLGDNCEFGFVQRRAEIEPLGLLRFAGISRAALIVAIRERFKGVGCIDNLALYFAGTLGRRELMVHELSLDIRYHTFLIEGEVDPDEFREREAKRLDFLRRKILDDLAVGEKIWVWREMGITDPALIEPLTTELRSLGPNTLLWVVEADSDHLPGTVERLDRDFLKGYVERLAPYENATEIEPLSWFEVCTNALALRQPHGLPEGPMTTAPPPLSTIGFQPLEQMTPQSAPPIPRRSPGWFSRLCHLLRF